MKKPKISIIIPIYNVPKQYLNVCMKSVLTQDYSNLEILLIDDGSTEPTATLCDEYGQLDYRVRVIHQQNSGVSKARNNGTLQCTGDFVMYVDSDDIISTNAVSNGVSLALKNDADIVIGAVKRISSYQDVTETVSKSSFLVIDNTTSLDSLKKVYFNSPPVEITRFCLPGSYISRAPYARMIKKDLAIKNPFPEGYPLGEDAIWNMRLLNTCNKVCISNDIWYWYFVHSSSAIRKYYGNRVDLAEKYLRLIYRENVAFCKNNIAIVGNNIAIEFYCILKYDLLASQCTFSKREKKDLVAALITQEPWKFMFDSKVKKILSFRFKILLFCIKTNTWIEFLNLAELLSKLKKYNGLHYFRIGR